METDRPSPDAQNGPASGYSWKLPVLLLFVLLGMLFWNRSRLERVPIVAPTADAIWTPSEKPAGEVVQLEIDFGNGAKRQFEALPWRADMTVADVMTAARDFRPGIRYAQIGEGASGFLTELEGLKNEGASGRNWRYEVAGTPGSMSFCLQKVASGELVRWTFAGEDEDL